MPINRKDFEEGNFKKRRNIGGEHPVAVLLSKNINLAYTINEIAKIIKMKPQTIRSMIRNFKKEGLIVHKAPYFAWKRSKK